jgi:hypothetical protein
MALPTNMNVGVIATEGVGETLNHVNKGVIVGALQTLTLAQGTDLGAGVTDEVICEVKAPFAGFIREVCVFSYDSTGVATADVYNATSTAAVIAAQTLSDKTSARVTSITTSAVAEGDALQLRVTTAGGGAAKGTIAVICLVPKADSTSNPFI